jgi:hypothetical protein
VLLKSQIGADVKTNPEKILIKSQNLEVTTTECALALIIRKSIKG